MTNHYSSNSNRRILLVEDDEISAFTTTKILELHQFSVVWAISGKKAIELIKEISDIDLILMDIDLGDDLDGIETAKIILKQKEIPLVFYSSHTEPEIVNKTEEITSYGYIVKHSGDTVLLASIRMAFKLFEEKQHVVKQQITLSTILYTIPQAVFWKDSNGTFLGCNRPFAKLLVFRPPN